MQHSQGFLLMDEVQNNDKKVEATGFKWLPVTSDYCTGCGSCVEECPEQCLELEWSFAKLTNPEKCTGDARCVEVCDVEGLKMDWTKMTGDQTIGIWCEKPETEEKQPGFWNQIKQVFGSSSD